jgi:hypothetical protein
MGNQMYIGGRPVNIDDSTTGQEVKKQANVGDDRMLLIQSPDGYEIWDEKQPLPKNKRIEALTDVPRGDYGIDLRKQRVNEEARILSYRYQTMVDENTRFLGVKDFPLNRNYSQSTTHVLVKIPKKYPNVPPKYFYLFLQLRYKGGNIPHFYRVDDFNELAGNGFGKYCYYLLSWKPSRDIKSGDNLIKFLEQIKAVLDNPERKMR